MVEREGLVQREEEEDGEEEEHGALFLFHGSSLLTRGGTLNESRDNNAGCVGFSYSRGLV